jgi:hypothetical protein
MTTATVLFARDPHLGNIYVPSSLTGRTFYPGGHSRRAIDGEIGIFVAKHRRPRLGNGGAIVGYDTLWASITHNERVDVGAQQQAVQVFGGGGSPASPSATLYPKVMAIANGTLTKNKADLSLGSTSANVTTNEFTTIGLSRVAVATIVGGNYTAPSSLGGTFSQVVTKTFTASGGGTAYGAGLFDSTTVSGSILYVEDNFASTAVLVSGDTITVTVTITN